MRRVELLCLALGGLLVSVGAGLVFVPAGLIVFGVLLMFVAYPRGDAR